MTLIPCFNFIYCWQIKVNWLYLSKINKKIAFQINDKKQEISITINRKVIWQDTGILVNQTHPKFDKAGEKSSRRLYRLDENFIRTCLWTPNIRLFGVKNIKIYRLFTSSSDGTTMEAYLGTDGTITLLSIELQLTIHCTMDFRMYPFDQQVSCKMPQSRAMMNKI